MMYKVGTPVAVSTSVPTLRTLQTLPPIVLPLQMRSPNFEENDTLTDARSFSIMLGKLETHKLIVFESEFRRHELHAGTIPSRLACLRSRIKVFR